MQEHENGKQTFREIWQEWADQPAQLDGQQAAQRVLASLPKKKSIILQRPVWATFAATSLVIFAAVIWFQPMTPQSVRLTVATPHTSSIVRPASSEGDMVIMMLDEDTLLYMALNTPGQEKGDS